MKDTTKYRKVTFTDGNTAVIKDLPKLHIFVRHDDNPAVSSEPLTREQHAVEIEKQRRHSQK